MKETRPFLTLFLLFFIGSVFSPARAVNEVGPDENFYLVYNYKYDWLVYSPQYNNFIPYSKELHETELSVSLLVDLLENRRYDLLITTSKESYLFVEGALQRKIESDSWLVLDIDSLYKSYRKEELLITLYGSPGIENKTVLIGHAKRSQALANKPGASSLSLINIKPLITSSFDDFSVLLIIFLLLLTLFSYSTAPTMFRRFLSLSDFIDRNERNDLYRFGRPYTGTMLMNALLVCTCMGYLFLFFSHHGLEIILAGGFLSEGDQLSGLLIDQLKLTGLFLLLLFLKYILMGIVGGVLNIERVINLHYIKALQISYVFYGLATLLLFALSLQNPIWIDQVEDYLILIFVFFYIIRFVVLYIFTNYSGQFINLYLFSYLCVVEIIPLIIGVKYAI
jgi:hypothetical protein